MYNSLALVAALWPAAITAHCTPPTDALIVGVALNSRREFLYCEYFSQSSEQQFTVNYVRNNASFASKTLDYSISPYMPAVNQRDLRTGEHRESQIDQQQLRLRYQPSNNKKIEITTLAIAEVDVVDAGFDNFVKDNWDTLVSGNSLAIDFGSIAHVKSLPLRISALAAEKCGQQKKAGGNQQCFSVAIDNALLRLLASNITIIYDDRKRLQQFSGVVNLQDDLQKSQSATINYFYKEDHLPEAK